MSRLTSRRARPALAVALALVTSGAVAIAPHAGASTVPGPTVTTKNVVARERGFDIASAPTTSALRAWSDSPYRAVNMYFSGSQRYDTVQAELSKSWVTTVLANGWDIIPTVVDRQAPKACYGDQKASMSTDPATAAAQGRSAADDAIDGTGALTATHTKTPFKVLGVGAGAIAYIDIEPYTVPTGNTTCVRAIRYFLKGWTNRMHARGYRAGVYSRPVDAIRALYTKTADSSYPQPDAIWFARYDGVATTASSDIPSSYLPLHRIHQYAQRSAETYGRDVRMTIDRDAVAGDALRAKSVALPAANSTIPGVTYFAYAASTSVATSETLKERVAPSASATRPPSNKTYANGEELDIVCQAAGLVGDSGGTVHGDYIWDKLVDGNYVSDLYTNTTGGNGVSSAIRHCETTPPTLTVTPLPTTTLRSSVTVSYSATDDSGIGAYDVRWRSASDRSGFGSWHYPAAWHQTKAKSETLTGLAPGGTYCLSVRAYDRLTNRTKWSPETCVARPLDDRPLSAGSLWQRKTGDSYYLHTFTATKTYRAALSRTGEQLTRVGIVATTCPSCGKVRILIAGQSVGVIDLTASSTHFRRTLLLAPFAYTTGTVKVRVISTGRTVQVDGLVVSRR